MKKISPYFFALVICITYIQSGFTAHSMTVITPPNRSLVENELVNLVLKIDKEEIDSVQVQVNNFAYPKQQVAKDRGYFCSAIILATGMNLINISGFKGKEQIVEENIEVFLRSRIVHYDRNELEAFTKYFFHLPEREKPCSPCHQMNIDSSGSQTSKPEDSPCYTCHYNKLDQKYTHGPSAAWMCLVCHKKQSEGPKYTITINEGELCSSCHDVVETWLKSKQMHGPAGVGQCTLCHDPHGAEWPYMVRTHTTDLCITCHEKKGKEKHVTFGFSRKSHPIRGVPDPFNPDKEFTCATCHNPHASNYDYFLNHSNKGGLTMYCTNCHKK